MKERWAVVRNIYRSNGGEAGKRLIRRVVGERAYKALKLCAYRITGQPARQGETAKARPRREQEGFFDLYCRGRGLDIGYGGDLVTPGCDGWDSEHGDAQYLESVADQSYDFVYSSHTLEHMVYCDVALKNWWRVLKPGGYLLLSVPHRDLYEKKQRLPSRWNSDHKHFFLPDRDDPPDTIGLEQLLREVLDGGQLIYIRVCREGHSVDDPYIHSDGEYSIEAVYRKGPN